ncbi:MAG: Ig-like domain-containing protein [Sagittula sp.]|uniref:Ig-like domain-containing protein n=1 Tax=Sagittula sp. TaxID=2038081 RepID=UPI0040597808
MTNYYADRGEFLVNSETRLTQDEPAIAGLSNGGFVATWRTSDTSQDGSGSAIKAQVFDAAGAAVGPEFLVNSETVQNQTVPAVTGLNDGRFVVTWQTDDTAQDGSSNAIKAQVFDAAGTPVGGEFLVNSETYDRQAAPEISALATGGFAVTWYTHDGTQDGSTSAIKARTFDAAAQPVGAEFLVNTAAQGSQIEPRVAGLTNGGLVVTWRTNYRPDDGSTSAIKAQIISAAGFPVGGEFLVNTETAGGQYRPAVTGLTGGRFVVTWDTKNVWQDGDGFAIKAQIYEASGAPVGGEFLVNTESVEHQYEPEITALGDGGFVITWYTEDYKQDGSGSAIKAQVFDADGAPVGEEFLVNSEGSGGQYDPEISALSGGGFVVTWRTTSSPEDGSGSAIKAKVYEARNDIPELTLSTTGVSETHISNTSFADVQFPLGAGFQIEIADDANGAFGLKGNTLVVLDNTLLDHETTPEVSLTLRITDPQGNSGEQVFRIAVEDEVTETRYTASDEFLVNSETEGWQFSPTITGLTKGGFVVSWHTSDTTQDGSSYAIKAQVFGAAGDPVGAEFLVNSEANSGQVFPEITALANGGFVITWRTQDSAQDRSYDAIKAQVFNATGAPVGGEFLVNTETAQEQLNPRITSLTDGGFVVTWYTKDYSQDGYGAAVKAQVFDASGTPVGVEFLVNSVTSRDQVDPAVAGLTNGGFVVTWRTDEIKENRSDFEIKAQIFDAAGTPVGGEFLVNSESAGDQYNPGITGLANGRFIVTWRGYDPSVPSSYSTEVKARIFDASGAPVRDEFRLNSQAAGGQDYPSITGLPDGGFVATWQTADYRQDGSGSAIKAQVFDAEGAPVGDEFLVNDEGQFDQQFPEVTNLPGGGFVVSWHSRDIMQDGSGAAIKARMYLPSGTGPNTEPSAGDASGRGHEDTVITGDLAALVSDADGDVLTFTIGTDATSGTLILDPSGSYSYVPDADFNGTDSFSYVVHDGNGGTATATVSLTVDPVNDAPRIDTATSILAGEFEGPPAPLDPAADYDGDGVANGADNAPFVANPGQEDGDGDGVGDSADLDPFDPSLGRDPSLVNGVLLFSDPEAVDTQTASFSLLGTTGNPGSLDAAALEAMFSLSVVTSGSSPDGSAIWTFDADPAQFQHLGSGDALVIEYRVEIRDNHGAAQATAVRVIVIGTADGTVPRIIGTGGADSLVGTVGSDVIEGFDGDDTMLGGAGDDIMAGGGGTNLMRGQTGRDLIDGGEQTDIIHGGRQDDALYGHGGDDFVYGEAGNDLIWGGAGHDVLHGIFGNDEIYGEDGNDSIYGGGGTDFLYGGSGNDTIDGGAGDNVMRGHRGNDLIIGGDKTDIVFGDKHSDEVHGNGGDDFIFGQAGKDTLWGGDGNDVLNGIIGDDELYGEAGNDVLYGGGGSDSLYGGDGDDTLDGQWRNDVLTGGAGADCFKFTTAGDMDTITDFQDGIDVLDFSADGLGFADFTVAEYGGGAGTVLTGGGYTVLLAGVDTIDIGTGDFA